MIMITKLIMLGIATVCALTLTFIVLDFVTDKVKSTSSKKRNHVKFYVARDKTGHLFLHIGKPERRIGSFLSRYGSYINSIANVSSFKYFGLNPNDFKDLKWEDEPVEVFVNMED